ncbi:MAG: hypothetical protein ACK521_05465 [bacterium]
MDIEDELMTFFHAMKTLPSVQKVKLSTYKLTQEPIIEIIVENNTRANIHQLLEF